MRSDHFACDSAGRLQHGLAFLLNVEGAVLAGKLRELVGGFIQIPFCNFETIFEKHALSVCGRSREPGHQRIQFVDVGVGNGRGALCIVVRDTDGDDAALAIFGNGSVFVELRSRIDEQPFAVDFSQVELLYKALLGCLASQHSDKKCARIFDS